MSRSTKSTAERLRDLLRRTPLSAAQDVSYAQDVSVAQKHHPQTSISASTSDWTLSYPYISTILKDCLSSHEQCSSTEMSFPEGARVIDCARLQIVSLRRKRRYLALSYVWGADSRCAHTSVINGEHEQAVLPSPLPQTILDAIEITIKLGYRYLWVDRYCIEQGHSADKLHQINQMGNIYSCAVAAICALGSSDEAGIFGVSEARDKSADRVVGAAQCLRNSVWSTRGWTLQEMVLARRCLIFSAEACYMACFKAVYNDDIARATPMISDFDSYGSGGREGVLFPGGNMGMEIYHHRNRHAFTQLRDEYVKRTLGFETDIFNAFVGILTRYPYPSYCGVVAFPQDEVNDAPYSFYEDVGITWSKRGRQQFDDNFLLALMWRVNRGELSMRRASALPSWTWLNQTRPFIEKVDEWPAIQDAIPAYRALIKLPSTDGSIMLFSEYKDTFRGPSSKTVLPFHVPQLYIRSVVVEWTLEVIDGRRGIRQQWGTREKWPSFMPDTTSEIWWDNLPPEQLSNFGTATDVARVPTKGLAVLMVGHQWGLQWDWLLIRANGDGKYEREGLVRFRIWSAMKKGHFVPPEEYVKSIELV